MTSGFTVERAIVVDDQMRTMDDDDVYAVGECVQHRGEVYGLVAPLWEQAVVLADQITGRDLQAAYHGSRTATKLKVAGRRRRRRWVCRARSATPTSIWSSPSPSSGVYKSLVIRDEKLIGATVARRHLEGRVPDAGLRPRAAAAGGTAGDDVQPRRPGRPRCGAAELADDAQVCNCNGVTKGALVHARGGRLQVGRWR